MMMKKEGKRNSDLGRETFLMTGMLILAALIPLAGFGQVTQGAEVTTLSDGSPEGTVGFTGEGENASISLAIPKRSTVNSASFNLSGEVQGSEDPIDREFTFNDTDNNKAWQGGSTSQSGQKPDGYKGTAFSMAQYTAVQNSDDTYAHNLNVANKYAYQHFAFKVPMRDINSLSVSWEGGGLSSPQMGFDTGGASVFIFDSVASAWELVDEFDCGELWCEDTIGITYVTSPEDYLDENDMVHIMATSPYDHASNRVDTDFVKVWANGVPAILPEDPALDIGDDGDFEWSLSGLFNTTEQVTGQSIVDELNEHIDFAGAGDGDAVIPLSFYSATAGAITISDILINYTEFVDEAPGLLQDIPSDWEVQEDSVANDLIDLYDYFEDDHDPDLEFGVVNNSNPEGLQATIDFNGKMDFTTPTENWWGDVWFIVEAKDSENQTTRSNEFMVEVTPVNDRPALEEIGQLTATEKEEFAYQLSASDVDMELDPTEELTFDSNSTMFQVDPATGRFNFTPKDEDVGVHSINFSVQDTEGEVDYEIADLVVRDVNNAPVLEEIGDQTIQEDDPFLMTVTATDPDAKDQLTFTSEGDLFDIGTDGTINFTPLQRDVGEHIMTIKVSDGELADQQDVKFVVENVNDAPELEEIPPQTANNRQTFEYAVIATDQDLDSDPAEELSFSDDCELFDIDPVTGEISFEPAPAMEGEYRCTISVEDSHGLEDTVQFNLTVEIVNNLPSVEVETESGKDSFNEGKTIALKAIATDGDGDNMTFTWFERTDEGDVELGMNQTIEVKARDPGKHTYVVVVSDGIGEAEANMTVKVKDRDEGAPGFGAGLVITGMVVLALVSLIRRRR